MNPIAALHDWFFSNQRDFPWREERTPYRVWVSEIMLQQTRAEAVVPYFLRWMQRFPDIEHLAKAPLESVIKMWEGLGYYSRARNLHKAALEIVNRFEGKIPSSKEALSSLPGLGPYTVGAILNFGFSQKAVAIDGNVIRVLSRYFAISENVDKRSTRNILEEKALAFLDSETPWVSSEALIELGALVCRPLPECKLCPLQQGCLGKEKKIAEYLPVKNGKTQITLLRRLVAVIEMQKSFLVRKIEAGKLMADLYEFPYFECSEEPSMLIAQQLASSFAGQPLKRAERLPEISHTFTRYKAFLYPFLFQPPEYFSIPQWEWVHEDDLLKLPFSSGHRRIANLVCKRDK